MGIFSFICVILVIIFLIILTDFTVSKIKDVNTRLNRINKALTITDLNHNDEWSSSLISNIKEVQSLNLKNINSLDKELKSTKEELDKLKFELKNPPEYYEGQKLKDGRICTKIEIVISKEMFTGFMFKNPFVDNSLTKEYTWNYEFATPKTKPKK